MLDYIIVLSVSLWSYLAETKPNFAISGLCFPVEWMKVLNQDKGAEIGIVFRRKNGRRSRP